MDRAMLDKAVQMRANVVQVSIPAEVAFDLDSFQNIQKDILGKLGCMACCSGWDIRFDIERRFVVDSKLNVRSLGALG